jgi:hypothetical protein
LRAFKLVQRIVTVFAETNLGCRSQLLVPDIGAFVVGGGAQSGQHQCPIDHDREKAADLVLNA